MQDVQERHSSEWRLQMCNLCCRILLQGLLQDTDVDAEIRERWQSVGERQHGGGREFQSGCHVFSPGRTDDLQSKHRAELTGGAKDGEEADERLVREVSEEGEEEIRQGRKQGAGEARQDGEREQQKW